VSTIRAASSAQVAAVVGRPLVDGDGAAWQPVVPSDIAAIKAVIPNAQPTECFVMGEA